MEIRTRRRKSLLYAAVAASAVLLQGCPLYKPELKTNKCFSNEDCPKGFACRGNRCEDIYHPEREISQF